MTDLEEQAMREDAEDADAAAEGEYYDMLWEQYLAKYENGQPQYY